MLTIRLKEAFATRIATTNNLLQQDLQQLNFKAFLPQKVFLPLHCQKETTTSKLTVIFDLLIHTTAREGSGEIKLYNNKLKGRL